MKTIEIDVVSYDEKIRLTFAVNNSYEGLFRYDRETGEYKQLLGTCQFYARTTKKFMRRFRALYGGEYGYYQNIKAVRGASELDKS